MANRYGRESRSYLDWANTLGPQNRNRTRGMQVAGHKNTWGKYKEEIMKIGKITGSNKKGFRWKIISKENGQTIGTSDQAFEHKQHATEIIDSVLKCTIMQTIRNTLVLAQNMITDGQMDMANGYIQSAVQQLDNHQDRVVGVRPAPAVKRDKKGSK